MAERWRIAPEEAAPVAQQVARQSTVVAAVRREAQRALGVLLERAYVRHLAVCDGALLQLALLGALSLLLLLPSIRSLLQPAGGGGRQEAKRAEIGCLNWEQATRAQRTAPLLTGQTEADVRFPRTGPAGC